MNTPNIAQALKSIDHWIDRIEFYEDEDYTKPTQVVQKLRNIKSLLKQDLKMLHAGVSQWQEFTNEKE